MKRLLSLSLKTDVLSPKAPELEFIQESPYKSGPCLVFAGMYLGDAAVAMDHSVLHRLSIRTVINVAKEVNLPISPNSPTLRTPPMSVENHVERAMISPESDVQGYDQLVQSKVVRYKFAWTHDQDLHSQLEQALDLIQKHSGDGSVLVHCQQGISRSVALIIAMVMRSQSLKCFQAYEIVKKRCPHISPNVNLISQLVAMESKWNL